MGECLLNWQLLLQITGKSFINGGGGGGERRGDKGKEMLMQVEEGIKNRSPPG